MIRGVAQLASALAWGARGRKFESSHPDESKENGCDESHVRFLFVETQNLASLQKKNTTTRIFYFEKMYLCGLKFVFTKK